MNNKKSFGKTIFSILAILITSIILIDIYFGYQYSKLNQQLDAFVSSTKTNSWYFNKTNATPQELVIKDRLYDCMVNFNIREPSSVIEYSSNPFHVVLDKTKTLAFYKQAESLCSQKILTTNNSKVFRDYLVKNGVAIPH
jgi:hypothetical protein